VSLASLSLDAGFAELCSLVIRRGSKVNLASELQYLDIFQVSDCRVVLFVVPYSSNPLSKKCHFGHVGDTDPNLIFVLQKTAPVTTSKSKERRSQISKASMLTLQEINSDCLFESDSHAQLRKPDFFFGDSIEEDGLLFMTGITNGFARLAIRGSFSQIWNRCIPWSIYIICPCVRQWIGSWSGHSLELLWAR